VSTGCVNTVEWSEDARLLVTGSDDLHVHIYEAHSGALLASHVTGHCANVFCAKFQPGCTDTLVTTAADGEVRVLPIGAPGASRSGAPLSRCLFRGRAGMGMKVVFLPDSRNVFMSTHQDGKARLFDLRAPVSDRQGGVVVDLVGCGAASDLVFDPSCEHQFALGSDDPFIRLFDIRRSSQDAALASQQLARLVPPHIAAAAVRSGGAALRGLDGVSGLAWGLNNRLVASYRGADVYLFDTRPKASQQQGDAAPSDVRLGCVQRYRGRRNVRTFLKGVAFMCHDQYVATGGDCGGLYVWHAASGSLAARLTADGAVLNAVAPHPHGLPVLCVSGIDDAAKLVEPGDVRCAGGWRLPRSRADREAAALEAAQAQELAARDALEGLQREEALQLFTLVAGVMPNFDASDEEEEGSDESEESDEEEEEPMMPTSPSRRRRRSEEGTDADGMVPRGGRAQDES